MKHFLPFLLVPILTLGINVGYYFKSSNLILEISGKDDSYTVKVASETYTSTKTVVIPWEKGKVEPIIIIGDKTGEREKLMIEGVHDSPPHISLKVPSVVGLLETKVTLDIWDDWDTPDKLKISCFVDNMPSSCHEIEPIYLEGEKHSFEVRTTDSFGNTSVAYRSFKFDPKIPKIPEMNFNSPSMVTFPKSPTLRFIMPDLGIQEKVSALKLDRGYVLQPVSNSGNYGEAFVIPPLPQGLTPFPGKAITSVSDNFILLGSEQYSIIGKVLLPQGKTIALSENSRMVMPLGSNLMVKGILQNVSGKPKIVGEGKITLMENGEIYLSGVDFSVRFSANGGKILDLEHVNFSGDLNVTATRYLFLKDMKIRNLICSDCKGVYLINVKAHEISLNNNAEIVLDSLEASNVSISSFSRVTLRNSTILTLSVDTLSRVDSYGTLIKFLSVDKGSFLRMRNCEVSSGDVKWFSKILYHDCKMGSFSTSNSEVVKR